MGGWSEYKICPNCNYDTSSSVNTSIESVSSLSGSSLNTLPNHLQSQDDLRTCHSKYLDD